MLTEVIYLTRKADRERMAADIRKALEPLGVTVETSEGLGRCLHVNLAGHGLEAGVWLDGSSKSDVPLIHWHNAARPLAGVRGAWTSVNAYHGCKATSLPSSMIDLIEKLLCGFQAAADGSAFRAAPDDTDATPTKAVYIYCGAANLVEGTAEYKLIDGAGKVVATHTLRPADAKALAEFHGLAAISAAALLRIEREQAERTPAPTACGWKVRRAQWSLRQRGNRDLYLTHESTGATASIAPDGRGLFSVQLAGGLFPAAYGTRLEALRHVAEYGLAAYFETTPETLAAYAKVGLDRWERQQIIRQRIGTERGLGPDALVVFDDPEYLKACEALDRLTLARAASLESAA